MPKNITDCFKSGSIVNIKEASGELKEGYDKITALRDGVNLECAELIETGTDGSYIDGKTPTTITGTNKIVFTKDHKVYCGEFIEN